MLAPLLLQLIPRTQLDVIRFSFVVSQNKSYKLDYLLCGK